MTLPPAIHQNETSHLATQTLTLIEAVNVALKDAMTEDDSVVVLGEDVATNGGVFRATDGLKDAFGARRVFDTPLAETLIAGTSIGMASQGLRPVAEIQFMGFIYSTLEHLICHASRLRNRTRGRLTCPMVLRAPFGGGIHAPEHHSESTESLFCHIPGLRVVVPSSPKRAYGLLLSAIRSNDPVIFLEPKRNYRAFKSQMITTGEGLPLDKCFTLREGQDLTIITWGSLVKESLLAAELLAEQGYQAEVIDLANLKPLDMESLLISVEKTGRALIVHEAARSGGLGAEIATRLQESAFHLLKAPVQRLTGLDTIMPYLQNEGLYLLNEGDILQASLQLVSYRSGRR